MPIVSGFVVPKMKPTSNVGGIRLLRLVVVAAENNPYCPLSFFGEYQPLEAVSAVSLLCRLVVFLKFWAQ